MMTNVNGHAALPVLQVCPPAKRADLARRDLRRRARQVRQESLEAGQRRRLTAQRPALKLVHTTVDLDSPPIELAGKPKGTGKVERRKRRPEPAPPARPESKPVPVPSKPPKARQRAVTGPQQPAPPNNPEQAAASGKRTPGRKPQSAVSGTKKETVLALLRRPQGATLAELMQATGWQSHSVRGFLSGALRRKMGLKVRSSKRDGVRVYSLRG